MSRILDDASAELLARLQKHSEMPPNSGPTREMGGLALASGLLEKLMRLALEDIATAMGTTADSLVRRLNDALRARRATGGQLSRALSSVRDEPAATRPHVRLLVQEASQEINRIRSVVEARNEVIHGDEEPATARIALEGLRRFLEEYRRDAGWTSRPAK